MTLFAAAFMACNSACAWNDNLDVDFDRQVFRCRLRPIVRRAITPLNGYIYAAALFGLGQTLYVPQTGLMVVIDLFIGSSVLGVGIPQLGAAAFGRAVAAIACLYTATGTWVIVYEGTYSFQDLTHDLKAGISA
ncbi:hypothetical protein BDR22DRAFT_886165 [Usnea florida]